MRSRTKVILGADVGATTIAAGLVTPAGEVLHTAQRPTHGDGPGTAVKALLALVEEVVADAEQRDLHVDAVGVGLPGVIEQATQTMLGTPPNLLPEFHQIPIADELQRIASAPAFIENDANALALGEWTFGAGRGGDSVAVIAIGTEVGGGVVVDGRLVRGAHGYAGEFHGIVVNVDGEPCPCGARGCLGSYVSGRALAVEARRRIADGARSSMVELADGRGDALTAVHVFAAARAGDAVARAVVDRACTALGAGIAVVMSCLNPDVIVVTGGVAQSLVPLADEVRRRVAEYASPRILPKTRVHVVGGDKRQTVRGGAAVVLYHRTHARNAQH